MVEGLRSCAPVGLLLQVVVANLRGGVQCLFNVAILQRAEHPVVVVGPHTGVKVGLQLQTHAGLVVALGVLAVLGHLLVGGVQGAQQVLHMMPHLVRDDVGVGKVAVSPDLAFHALEELQVEIHRLVGAAIEGAARRSGVAATRTHRIGIDHHLGRDVGLAHLPKFLSPNVFGAGENLFAELHQLLVHLAVVLILCVLGLRLVHLHYLTGVAT